MPRPVQRAEDEALLKAASSSQSLRNQHKLVCGNGSFKNETLDGEKRPEKYRYVAKRNI